MKTRCTKCSEFGLKFKSEHIEPDEYLEGNPKAEIWIIGLNPKADVGHVEKRTKEQFENFNPDGHRYFSDFKKVSPKLYANWISEKSNVAHTDLVKCFSHSFPPAIDPSTMNRRKACLQIISNCSVHLMRQLHKSRPKLIICNGSSVGSEILKLFPPEEGTDLKSLTSYKAQIKIGKETHEFWIVLSGFIGRVDDRNKRRLGREIEEIIAVEGIDSV